MQRPTNKLFILCKSSSGEIVGTQPEYFLLDQMDLDPVTGKGHSPCLFFILSPETLYWEITELLLFIVMLRRGIDPVVIYEYTVT
jgi:hypothetical protein